MNYMFMPLRRYADFNGRSRRMEYWLWQLFNVIVMSILLGGFFLSMIAAIARVDQRGGVDRGSSSDSSYGDTAISYSAGDISYRSSSMEVDPNMFMEEMGTGGWLMLGLSALWGLLVFIPNLAVTIRRLHDQTSPAGSFCSRSSRSSAH
jgi:uncharacterized membrane protein YhaH (DUF805 family)